MDLRKLDLNLLLVIEAMARERSVSRAATALGMRQPAVSGALARLRVLFDDELFVRAAGEMVPTPLALRLAPGVLAALGDLRRSLAEAGPFVPATTQETFTIGSNDYTSFVLLPSIVATLRERAPGASLRVVAYDKDDLSRLTEVGNVDLALGVFPSPPPRAVVTRLFRERFIGVCREGHPALVRGRMSLTAYLAAPHALMSTRRDDVGEVDRVLGLKGLSRRVALVVPHVMSLAGALASSDLVAAVPARVAGRFGSEGLVTFDLPFELPHWHIHMLWSADRRRDRGNAWLRGCVRAAAEA